MVPDGGDITFEPCPKKHYWTRLRALVTRRKFFRACDVTWKTVTVIEGTIAQPPTFVEGTVTVTPTVVSFEGVFIVEDEDECG